MRLIDADAFIKWLDIGHLRHPSEICISELDVKKMIDLQPTIEAEPVRYGEWEHLGHNKFRCTACERASYVETMMGEPSYERCPHCGAKMDGKKAEEKG